MHVNELPIFPSSIPAPLAIAPAALPAHLQPRKPFAPSSPNLLSSARTATPSSASKPTATRSSKKATRPSKSASTSAAPSGAEDDDGDLKPNVDVPLFLAPDYTLNPAGPASSTDTDFKCPQCDKVYRGKHARSIWRRHLQDKHGIPLSAQPRRTRWDNDANRPKSEEEKRARNLDSKRRWARKNRAEKTAKAPAVAASTSSGPAPPGGGAASSAGSVGTPASDNEAGDESADADSSFDATSVAGWGTEGAAAMNGLAGVSRAGSAPLGGPAMVQREQPGSNPFYPYAAAAGPSHAGPSGIRKPGSLAHLDPYGPGAGGRPPLRTASSLPPGHYVDDPRYAYQGGEYDGPPPPQHQPHPASHYSSTTYRPHSPGHPGSYRPHSPGHAGVYPPSANPYSHPFLAPTVEQPHHYPPPHPSLYDDPSRSSLLAPPSSVRRPASNPNPSLYDQPGPPLPAHQAHPVLAGQIAPVAQSYYARRQSPARVVTTLESPVKLGGAAGGAVGSSRTGNSGGLKPPFPGGPANGAGASSTAAAAAPAKKKGTEHPREDAAGILLALKAGPSSPMSAHALAVQSPVSNLRDRDTGEEDSRDSREGEEEEESDAEDAAEVRAQLMGGAIQQPHFPASSHHHHHALQHRPSPAHLPPGGVPVVSPQKRRRSESPPAPALASSSSNGEGSTAAAHALLATAKKAHGLVQGGWNHASLVATPTPGGLMQSMMESSPAVGRGGGGGYPSSALGGVGKMGGGGGGAESEGDLLLDGDGDDEDEEEGDLRRAGDEPFTSSSSGGRHRNGRGGRGRSESPSRQRRRAGAAGLGSSSSASSRSSARIGLHHHHPVGLTSELGEFDLHHSSSSEPRHHHHDPLRESAMLPPGGSASSSAGSYPHHHQHLSTPASSAAMLPSSSRDAPQPSQRDSAAHHHRVEHDNDPFLVPAGLGSATPGSALPAGLRTSSPPYSLHHPATATSSLISDLNANPASFLFSSPAHPQFSKTLGLTAAPGPGVLSFPGSETPGAASSAAGVFGGRGPRQREFSAGSIDGLLSGPGGEFRTPMVARIAGGHGGGGGGGGGGADSTAEESEEVDEVESPQRSPGTLENESEAAEEDEEDELSQE
ncbi:hypothetical protein JCM8097_001351 [Rhodosporidiobolus ruineniae]